LCGGGGFRGVMKNSRLQKGHGFSRAVNAIKIDPALAAEGHRFTPRGLFITL
jgi:hypothetical protein